MKIKKSKHKNLPGKESTRNRNKPPRYKLNKNKLDANSLRGNHKEFIKKTID